MLSNSIPFDKLLNIKKIKQKEYGYINKLDPDFIIEFNKNNLVSRIIAIPKDNSFIYSTNFIRNEKNCIELNIIEVYSQNDNNPKIINKNNIEENEINMFNLIKGDTSTYVKKYCLVQDTLIASNNLIYSADSYTFDTKYYIFKDNKLFKEIGFFSKGGNTKEIKESINYYDEKGSKMCEVINRFRKPYNYTKKIDEFEMTDTDTIKYDYYENGNIIHETFLSKNVLNDNVNLSYRLSEKKYQNNKLFIKHYETNKYFDTTKLLSEYYVEYNEKGLPINEKLIDVTYFLFFKKRNIYSNRTFEYTYWK
ncbi:MAG: hypothetical protein HXX18_09725 [Bacteroidetes bacterium]|nr:hypothetical protein [Bacteroidota bacterium]